MIKQLVEVAKFQRAFGQNVETQPTLISKDKAYLRFELMKEENEEYLQACLEQDLVEVADALTDQLYILCGTILEHGMQEIIEKCFEEVQRSNMSKLDDEGLPVINGENGILDDTRPLGKVLKSKNFVQPNLKQFLIKEESPKKEKFFPLKKGDKFLCKEDFVMDDGRVEYTKDKIYISEIDDCVTNNSGNVHHAHTELGNLQEYLTKI